MNNDKTIKEYLFTYSQIKGNQEASTHVQFFEGLFSKDEIFILEFVIRSKCYKGFKGVYFWTSKNPIKILSILLKAPEAKIILKRYFEKEENVNIEFIKEFSIKYQKEFIIIYRESEVYLKQKHFESTSYLKYSNNQYLYKLRYEIEYIKHYIEYMDNKEKYYFALLKDYSMEEVMIHVVSYLISYQYESRMYTESTKHASDVIHNVVTNLPYILKENLKTKSKIFAKMGKEGFYDKLKDELPRIKSNEYVKIRKKKWYSRPPENESPEKTLIREVIDFYIYKSYILNLFNNYAIGYYNFFDINGLNSELISTELMGNYHKNDLKIVYEENYLNEYLFNQNDSEVKNLINKNLFIVGDYLNLYEFPKEFKYKEKELEILDIFKVLYNFSYKLKPLGRNYFGLTNEKGESEELKYFEKNHEDYEFKRIFDNYEICIFTKEELIQKTKRYFGWSLKYAEAIIDFLTLDIEEDFDPDDFPAYPFISHGDYFYWVSKLLKDINWRNILFKKFIQKKVYNIQEQTQRLEKKLEQEFIRNGFKAASGYKYKGQDNKSAGDIDVCAVKDGYLFLIELKMTYFTSDTDRIYNYEEEKIYSYNASEQLSKGIEFLKNNEDIRKQLGIENIETIKMLPLIVSNSFFADDESFHSQYLKISYLELIIILNNSLRRLLKAGNHELFREMGFNSFIKSENLIDPSFSDSIKSLNDIDINLWTNSNFCSGIDLYSAITEDKVWSDFKQFYNPYYPFKIEIKEFEENYKLLRTKYDRMKNLP